ncbi:MAG: hypothetical protein AB1714_12865 [Acidobacteriota bacterium]
MKLVAVKDDIYPTVLRQRYSIDDPLGGHVRLPPTQVLSGEIDLARRFPDIVKALKGIDVILFWHCVVKDPDARPLGTFGGWLLLPQCPR